jgi:hypothetical protein
MAVAPAASTVSRFVVVGTSANCAPGGDASAGRERRARESVGIFVHLEASLDVAGARVAGSCSLRLSDNSCTYDIIRGVID